MNWTKAIGVLLLVYFLSVSFLILSRRAFGFKDILIVIILFGVVAAYLFRDRHSDPPEKRRLP